MHPHHGENNPPTYHYIFLIPIYKLVISDNILVLIATPQVKWHPVTDFTYGSVVIYIVVMRWDLPYQGSTSFNLNQRFFRMPPI